MQLQLGTKREREIAFSQGCLQGFSSPFVVPTHVSVFIGASDGGLGNSHRVGHFWQRISQRISARLRKRPTLDEPFQ